MWFYDEHSVCVLFRVFPPTHAEPMSGATQAGGREALLYKQKSLCGASTDMVGLVNLTHRTTRDGGELFECSHTTIAASPVFYVHQPHLKSL